MAHAGQSGNRRWYDEEPYVGKAIEQVLTLPVSLQVLLCEVLLTYVQEEERQHRLSEQLHSLGSQQVLSLYKAKLCRREYDQHAMVRDALNGMSVLSKNAQKVLAGHIFQLSRIVLHYLKLCKTHQQPPNQESVLHFFQLYRSGSLSSVEAALAQVENRFKKVGQKPARPSVGMPNTPQAPTRPRISSDADRLE